MTPLRQRMTEDMQVRNFSLNTQLAYLQQVTNFAKYFDTSPERLGPADIRAYQVHITTERKLAPGSLSIIACALRFLYKVTLKQDWVKEEIPLPKTPYKLPVILSREEVGHFLACIASCKHRTLLMTAYSAGLRVTEATRLKITDIDSQRMTLRIAQGKGAKDRLALSGRYPRPPNHQRRGRTSLSKGPSSVPDHQANYAPFPPPCLRHPFAGSRHRCAHHPIAARSSQSGHDRAVFEGGHHHRLRDH